MAMISYAQNAEDVRLSRLFPEKTDGYYIDIGASYPEAHSVTKHFYDRGWHGINVEPLTEIFQILESERTRDINLNTGLSNCEGSLTFYAAPTDVGRSTFAEEACKGWQAYDGCTFVERAIPVTTLKAICERYVDRPIDFLKIDVEGHELAVLEGADLRRWRPLVIVLEGQPTAWEHILFDADYVFAAGDGINQYYLRAEDQHLAPILARPISILDNYVLHEHEARVKSLKADLAVEHARLEFKSGELTWACQRIRELETVCADRLALIDAHAASLSQALEQVAKLETICADRLALVDTDAASLSDALDRVAKLEQKHADLGPRTLAIARRGRSIARHIPGASFVLRRLVQAG